MTKRIAFAILFVTWLALLTAGVSTFFITRSLLLLDLDETIVARIASLPEVERPASLPGGSDRYVVQNAQGKIIATSTTTASDVPVPLVLNASFGTLADGTRVRTLYVQVYRHRDDPTKPLEPINVVFSASAEPIDRLLRNLLLSLIGFGLFAVGATAMVARSVAKVALRPLNDTANVIGAIDETSLDRRIAVDKLPVELAPVAKRLNDMLARLETAFAQRKQFLADASHELRTPVAGMVTTIEVALRRARDPEEYRRILESCLSDAHLLHQLVIALLDQVRSERFNSRELELAPTPVTTLLRHCGQLAATLGGPKDIRVEQRIPDDLVLLTDETKLRSIVTNLLSNAIEYTPPHGLVQLVVELQPDTPGKAPWPPLEEAAGGAGADVAHAARRLVIRVIDNGPGIAPEHLPNLFEPFYRADFARTNPEHHLGLGLSLVKSCVRSLGGEVQVKSPPVSQEKGAEFIIDLPTLEMRTIGSAAARTSTEKTSKSRQEEHV
jgi:signal transduction histidine kinase